jgi:hypothetical protein
MYIILYFIILYYFILYYIVLYVYIYIYYFMFIYFILYILYYIIRYFIYYIYTSIYHFEYIHFRVIPSLIVACCQWTTQKISWNLLDNPLLVAKIYKSLVGNFQWANLIDLIKSMFIYIYMFCCFLLREMLLILIHLTVADCQLVMNLRSYCFNHPLS